MKYGATALWADCRQSPDRCVIGGAFCISAVDASHCDSFSSRRYDRIGSSSGLPGALQAIAQITEAKDPGSFEIARWSVRKAKRSRRHGLELAV